MGLSSESVHLASLRSSSTSSFGCSLHVVLVSPEIHWNTGNAGRTCLAAGARLHLVEPLGFSLAEREVRRAGLDYWERVPPTLWPSWPALEEASPRSSASHGSSPESPTELLGGRLLATRVLVFGRESDGLPADLRERYRERTVAIPIGDPEVRSLNLSTAVGIGLYEVLRQWREVSPTLAATRRRTPLSPKAADQLVDPGVLGIRSARPS